MKHIPAAGRIDAVQICVERSAVQILIRNCGASKKARRDVVLPVARIVHFIYLYLWAIICYTLEKASQTISIPVPSFNVVTIPFSRIYREQDPIHLVVPGGELVRKDSNEEGEICGG
jgi:hypothetical protein